MTKLNRPLKREVTQYIIMLEPPIRNEPAIVRIKPKGKRFWVETTIEAIYHLACKQAAQKMIKARAVRKGGKKE